MLDVNRKIKQRVPFPLSAKASRICRTPLDCISRHREFDSGLARFNTFVEIGHEIISTAPARIQFRATIARVVNLGTTTKLC